MKNILLLLFTSVVSVVVFSQQKGGNITAICKEHSMTQDTSLLVVNRFKRKYKVSVKVNGLRVGRNNPIEIVRLNFSEKCKLETSLIHLNDSTAIKVQLAKSTNNGEKELHCRLKVYYLIESCWKLNGHFNFNKITSKNTRSSNMSIGGNSSPFVELDNVLIRVE